MCLCFLISGGQAVADLESYKWHNRLLLVFAPSPDDPAYQQQLELLENETDLAERDLLLFHVFENQPGFANKASLSEAESLKVREQFNVAEQAFTTVLVGKDGTEKQRWNEPVKNADLFALIDQMPMRQEEIR
jgi:Domain of unknown function (DUF4174)